MRHYKERADRNESLLGFLIYKYLPFWPIFAALIVILLFCTWIYLRYATPVYEVTATLLINDEKKGVEDSDLMKSMSAFDTKKIVENEIEVIQSKDLMRSIVDDLFLYAPIFEKSPIKSISAYATSPITIKIKNSELLSFLGKDQLKEEFTYDSSKEEVHFDEKVYSLDTWIKRPYGQIIFLKNNNYKKTIKGNIFYFKLSNPKAVTEDLLENLDVAAADKVSTVVHLTFEDPVPERGKNILSHLISGYNQKTLKNRNSLAINTQSFIEQRIKNVEADLNKLETEIQHYRSDEGAVDLSEQSKLYLEDIGESGRKIAEIKIQLDVLDNVEEYVISKGNKGGIVPSTAGIDNPVLSQLLEKLYDVEVDYDRLRKTTAENNPILQSLDSKINKMRPSILENVRSQRENLESKLKNLNTTNRRFTSSLRDIPKQERVLLEISRRKAIKSELFAFLLQKREETALSYVPNDGESRLVDSAEASVLPVSPKPILYYLGAFICAIGLGIAYVGGKEMLSNKVLFRSEIDDYTNVPVIAELSYVKENENILFVKPEAPVVIEQFRQLGVKLGLYNRDFHQKKILITSSIAGEGKSYVSTNLAYSLAESGKKVGLIDMDFRKPITSKLLDLSANPGIVDFLKGVANLENIVYPSAISDNLFIIPAGTKGGDHTKLLLNGKLDLFFNKMSEGFDYFIIDSAPIDIVSDANLIAEYCDKTLLVIRHAYTSKNVIKYLDDSSNLKIVENMAIIFNGIKNRGFLKVDYGYGYGNVGARGAIY